MFVQHTTAVPPIEQLESVLVDVEALRLHVTDKLWEMPEQLNAVSGVLCRYEELADELRLAIAAFR
ncbi:hypothetical protein [Edaphobacter modestus]|uniref:hypothetical protein n=1 Tax=Edaphobacter modestus TaxID=388466 RepID=UPI00102C2B93|nr:hypothetical protein [Edaphobacter modestus]